MTRISIDRLVVHAPHLGRADAERLARLVAHGLRGNTPRGATETERIARQVLDDARRAVARRR